jgi:hypothetical protein
LSERRLRVRQEWLKVIDLFIANIVNKTIVPISTRANESDLTR